MRRKGKKRARIALVAFLLVIACALVVLALATRDPYAFLDRFHPKRIEVDVSGLLGIQKNSKAPKMTVLVFRNSDHEAVLQAMQRELTRGKGFSAHPTELGADTVWQFDRTSSDPAGAYGATYSYGPHAAWTLKMLRSGKLLDLGGDAPWNSKAPACTVELAQ